MNWTTSEMEAGTQAGKLGGAAAVRPFAVRRIMDKAAELLAARGGTMTAETYRSTLAFVEAGHTLSPDQASELLAGYEAASARVVTLGEKVAALEDRLRAVKVLHDEALARVPGVRWL